MEENSPNSIISFFLQQLCAWDVFCLFAQFIQSQIL